MGMYTCVAFHAEVDTYAANLFRTIQSRYSWNWPDDALLENTSERHEFFTLDRWPLVFFGSSAYEHGSQSLTVKTRRWGDLVAWEASFLTSLKNYSGEVDQFFDWVAPHVVGTMGTGGFMGWSLYETNEIPTLYYAQDGKAVIS